MINIRYPYSAHICTRSSFANFETVYHYRDWCTTNNPKYEFWQKLRNLKNSLPTLDATSSSTLHIQISISERSSGWAINYISRCHAAASRVKRSKFDSNLCRRVPLKVKIWRIAWSIKSFAKIHKLPTQTNLVTFRWYFTLRKNQSSGGEVLMNRLNCTENYIFLKYVPKS